MSHRFVGGIVSILIAASCASVANAGLMKAPSWTFAGREANGLLGNGGVVFGDFNKDGFRDIAFSEPNATATVPRVGRVYVFLGGASGLSATPAWTAEGDQTDAGFAFGQLGAGDFNADGFTDLVVGAHAENVNGHPAAGAAYVYYGGPASPGDPSGLGPNGTPDNADWSFLGTADDELLGEWVGDAGDVNGDGKHDLLVSAVQFSGTNPLTETQEGKVFLFYGATTGLGNTPSWTAEGKQAFGMLGGNFHTAHDVNGDGFDDIVTGRNCIEIPADSSACRGTVLLWLGSASGLGANGTPANADWTAAGDPAATQFAYWVSSLDANGDHYSDIAVGAPGETAGGIAGAGRVYVWMGGPSGAGNLSGLGPNGTPANADWKAEGDQTDGHMGFVTEIAGDIDKDGYEDLLTSTYYYDVSGNDLTGSAWVYRGSAAGLGPNGTATNAAWNVRGAQPGGGYGGDSHTVRDVNGDGFQDLWVVAPTEDVNGLTDAGRAYIYYGTCGTNDGDGDGVSALGSAGCAPTDFTDCNDADGGSWATPGPVATIAIGADKQTLSWGAVTVGGDASSMRYDLLRSPNPADFVNGTTCVGTGLAAATVVDAATPAADSLFAYLARARNGCPGGSGIGSLGNASNGTPRAGASCP